MILLLHDVFNIDRQEKQIKYDRALIAFIFYFAVDCVWAALIAKKIPVTRFNVVSNTLCTYLGMVLITYTWLEYVLAVEQVEYRNDLKFRLALSLPFIISMVIMVITYISKPGFLISDNLEVTENFNFFLVGAPYINLIAVMYYTIRRVMKEENQAEKSKHLLIGFFPLLVVAGGLFEMIFYPYEPIFCCTSTILMLVFFIQMIQRQVSVDPLTGLNNRGQLLRYVEQRSNIHKDNRLTYVIMIDINDFKVINDTYGHAEGDRALRILSDSLKKVVGNHNMPVFLGRYGGDEFIIIVHPQSRSEMEPFIKELRNELEDECRNNNTEFMLSIGIGYDELLEEPDTFQKCMQRADQKLYQDKRNIKLKQKAQ
ncbi:MAG: GGDEF domain-containing protein [Erysipelotrichaceae bacterium]|nr:GGDEF domain-containing protein [Erysipelotrichaceae bacterium]